MYNDGDDMQVFGNLPNYWTPICPGGIMNVNLMGAREKM